VGKNIIIFCLANFNIQQKKKLRNKKIKFNGEINEKKFFFFFFFFIVELSQGLPLSYFGYIIKLAFLFGGRLVV
jgi:hypothetical protein